MSRKLIKGMNYSGVFLTPDERMELENLVLESGSALLSETLNIDDFHRPHKRCYELALAHGLPEIEGYYGVTNDGELASWYEGDEKLNKSNEKGSKRKEK